MITSAPGSHPLEKLRESNQATNADETGRYYATVNGERRYGYRAHFSGAYVCYTCGYMCDCEE